MHTALRTAQPGNRRTRVFSICKEAYVGKPCRTPRETVYSPGMCSSPTSPDGVAHKPHVLSIKPSQPALHAGTSRCEDNRATSRSAGSVTCTSVGVSISCSLELASFTYRSKLMYNPAQDTIAM